nr:tail fiber domain-containing protein [Paraburkholderia bannensis]
MNANVGVLNTQATLTSASPNAVRDLTAADMGKRVNFTPTAASTVHFPAANTTGADQLVAIHNLSATYDITMAIAAGSGDTAPTIAVVKAGEMLTYETDGVSVWRTIGRKKAFDETVQGKLTVVGATTLTGPVTLTGGIAGPVTATGALQGTSLSIGTGPTYLASISAAGAYSGASASYTGAVAVGGNATVGGTLGVTGQASFTLRPTFASKVPWDAGNLAAPMTLDTAQTFTAAKTGNAPITLTPAAPSGTTGATNQAPGFAATARGSYQFVMYAQEVVGSSVAGILGAWSGSWKYWFFDANTGNATSASGSWVNSSDRRLKTNIEIIQSPLEKMRKLRGYTWERLDAESHGMGFVAQEVESVFPNGVHEIAETAKLLDGTVIDKPLGLDTGGVAAALHHEAILAMMDQIDALNAEVAALKGGA